jgi:hypothetical protein
MSEIIHRYQGRPGDHSYKHVRSVTDFLCYAGTDSKRELVLYAREEMAQAFLSVLLDPYTNPWHCYVEVVENYLPPNPRPETKPEIVVRWGNSFLRYGRRGFGHCFWDMYGDSFQSVQEAWWAVAQAPAPPGLVYKNRGAPPEDK